MIRRVLIISLLIVVLAEIALLLLNWQNMVNVYTTRFFTINSTTGLLLLTLVTHNAYAKVIITIENPSNETLLIHLSNGTTMTLGPNSAVKLKYLFTPSSYYAYPTCTEGFGLTSVEGPGPGTSHTSMLILSFLLNSMTNPIAIYENVTSIESLRQVTPTLLTQLRQSCDASGIYLIVTTAGGDENIRIMVIVSKLVIVV